MAGKRVKSGGGARRFLKGIYITLVVISVIIIGVYVAFVVIVRPPTVDDTGREVVINLPNDEDPDASPITTTTQLQRREGVYNILLVGSDDGNGNTDTIIVCSFDTKEKTIGMLSIPRDTLIDCDRTVKKINAAYANGGIETLEAEVEDLLGIPIDHYCHIDLRGVKVLVDQLGGVDFYIPMNMDYNDGAGLIIQYSEGWRTIYGDDAIKILRFRNSNQNGNFSGYNDTGRTETQQKFLVAVMKKMISWDSVPKINQFAELFYTYIKTSLSTTDLIYLGTQALGMDAEDFYTATVPGDGSVTYNNIPWYYVAYEEETLELVNRLVNPYREPLTKDALNIFDPTGVNA